MKKCVRCSSDILTYREELCESCYQRDYYIAHRNRIKARTSAFRKAHLDRHSEYNRRYRRNHPEQRERHAMLSKILRHEKPDIYKKHDTNWRKRHPEKVLFRSARYRARRRGADGSHTLAEWLVIKNSTRGFCPCCGLYFGIPKLTKDHIMSLKLGGSDYAWNLQPLCLSCNSSKGKQIINYLEVWKIVNDQYMKVGEMPMLPHNGVVI